MAISYCMSLFLSHSMNLFSLLLLLNSHWKTTTELWLNPVILHCLLHCWEPIYVNAGLRRWLLHWVPIIGITLAPLLVAISVCHCGLNLWLLWQKPTKTRGRMTFMKWLSRQNCVCSRMISWMRWELRKIGSGQRCTITDCRNAWNVRCFCWRKKIFLMCYDRNKCWQLVCSVNWLIIVTDQVDCYW